VDEQLESVGVLKVGGTFVHKGSSWPFGEKFIPPVLETPMRSAPLTPEKLADAQALADAIRAATADEIDALARTLVATADSHPFGRTEFKIRDLAHRIAATAIEQHLAQKKTATRGPV
jgi:hypothetical protein